MLNLEAIEGRVNAATPGLWIQRDGQDYSEIAIAGHSAIEQPLALVGSNVHDADFIAHAPEDMKYLLTEVKRLRGELDAQDESLRNLAEITMPKLDSEITKAIKINKALRWRLITVAAELDALKENFTDYVTDGIDDASPYCANKSSECTDKRGWCVAGRCKGFMPNTHR